MFFQSFTMTSLAQNMVTTGSVTTPTAKAVTSPQGEALGDIQPLTTYHQSPITYLSIPNYLYGSNL
jgi:hypothetical protein